MIAAIIGFVSSLVQAGWSVLTGIPTTYGTPSIRYSGYIPFANSGYKFRIGQIKIDAVPTFGSGRSDDGINWTYDSFVLDSQIVHNGSVAVTKDYYTTDGQTWTARTTVNGHRKLVYTGSAFWDFGYSSSSTSNNIRTSTDGINWTAYSRLYDWNDVAYSGSAWFAVIYTSTTTGTARYTTQTNPTNAWTAVTLPSLQKWVSCAFGASKWVAVAFDSTSYAYSSDGSTWTAGTLPEAFNSSGSNNESARLLFSNNKFWYYTNDKIISSTDGVNWTSEALTASTLNSIRTWMTVDNTIYGFGDDGNNNGTNEYIKGIV